MLERTDYNNCICNTLKHLTCLLCPPETETNSNPHNLQLAQNNKSHLTPHTMLLIPIKHTLIKQTTAKPFVLLLSLDHGSYILKNDIEWAWIVVPYLIKHQTNDPTECPEVLFLDIPCCLVKNNVIFTLDLTCS